MICVELIISIQKGPLGVPVVAQWLTNPTRNREQGQAGSIPGLAQRVKDPALLWAVVWVADSAQIQRCCGSGVGWRLQLRLDPYPGNLHMVRERQKDKKGQKKKKGRLRDITSNV